MQKYVVEKSLSKHSINVYSGKSQGQRWQDNDKERVFCER